MASREIRVFSSPEELFYFAATEFARLAADAVQRAGKFSVALSGGSTPKAMYSLLATIPGIPWEHICFFWGDERCVPPDDPESNYCMAVEALLSRVPARPENIFRIPAEEKDAEVAASKYEQELRTFFQAGAGEFPRFDLVLLGMGPDGHTASLFPGTAALQEKTRLVVANWVEKFHTYRITLILPVLNQARNVVFLASGKEKAVPLQQVFSGGDEEGPPAKLVRPVDGRLLWLVDEAAAAKVTAAQRNL